ncbi:hypothetical protein D918_09996, partial [Trichuris suis]
LSARLIHGVDEWAKKDTREGAKEKNCRTTSALSFIGTAMKLSIAVAALALFIYLVNGSPVHSLHGGPQVNQYNVFFNLEIGAANKSPMQKALSVVPSFVRSLFEKTALESQKEANATNMTEQLPVEYNTSATQKEILEKTEESPEKQIGEVIIQSSEPSTTASNAIMRSNSTEAEHTSPSPLLPQKAAESVKENLSSEVVIENADSKKTDEVKAMEEDAGEKEKEVVRNEEILQTTVQTEENTTATSQSVHLQFCCFPVNKCF